MTSYYAWSARSARNDSWASWRRRDFYAEYPIECPVRHCHDRFKRTSELTRHQRATEHFGHFFHAQYVDPRDVACKHCPYVPDERVMDPRLCLRRHMSRQHVMHARPYTIRELP